MTFNNVQFYYGSQEDYVLLSDNNGLDNYFYFTYQTTELDEEGNPIFDNKTIYRLFLNKEKVYDSDGINELTQNVIKHPDFLEKINEYVKLSSDTNQTITSNMTLQGQIEIKGNLSVENNISASNLVYTSDNKTLTVPQDIQLQAFDLKGTKAEISNIVSKGGASEITGENNTITVKALNFDNEAVINNIPTITISDGQGNTWIYNFAAGELSINKLTVNTLEAKTETKTETDNLTVNTLTIGNIILSEENGNLKITTVDNATVSS